MTDREIWDQEEWDDYGSEESLFDLLAEEADAAIDLPPEEVVAAIRKIREDREHLEKK
jgi:hypothetical protein